MANIILVHGMNANAKSWFDVKGFLEDKGHSVSAPTLSGHSGDFGIDLLSPVTMDKYVVDVAAEFPMDDSEKVILIGHSMGGQVITQVAATFPNRVEKLIYVAAMLPNKGQSAVRIIRDAGIDPKKFSESLESNKANYPDAFVSQPFAPLLSPLSLPSESDGTKLDDFDAMRRFYILATDDHILPTGHQKKMVEDAESPVQQVEPIESDHIPQASKPTELHEMLMTFVEAT